MLTCSWFRKRPNESPPPPDLKGSLKIRAVITSLEETSQPRKQNTLLVLKRQSQNRPANPFLDNFLIK
ncbi:hypothetical protein Nepgr_008300 [Nepenthes gracilis]|uniref:Uncharacterized protein n=1 Tax=Nepenthes gracilis TaxID=150966 RepID=A0AAD3S8S5_NEPGR|nr:hypothetical protein Nepgr_008300 [Nepenthes gracilis]